MSLQEPALDGLSGGFRCRRLGKIDVSQRREYERLEVVFRHKCTVRRGGNVDAQWHRQAFTAQASQGSAFSTYCFKVRAWIR